ncbi:centrosomal protein of 162 kDa [Gastrophryne carolinensis]
MAYRMSQEELDEQFEQFLKESLSDDSFDSKKRSTVLDNLGKPVVKRTKKKDTPPWWAADEDSDDGDLIMTSRSFIKSQSTSQPIEEVEEENYAEEIQQSTQNHLITSIEKDSLEIDESVMAYGPNKTIQVGLDTLEEQEEKERFFAKLENGASSTIDYSRLNKELDSTDSTQLTALNCNNENQKTEDDENKEPSVNYSEDFEDDPESTSPGVIISEGHEDLVNKKINMVEEKHGMLSKVMLLDSMDSTIDTQKMLKKTEDSCDPVTPQSTNEAIGTGISNQYTNSEMEALHQAYQDLDQSMECTDEQKSLLKATNHTSTSHGNTVDSAGHKILTENSDMSTVDELMQRINEDQGSYMASLSVKEQENDLLPHLQPTSVKDSKAWEEKRTMDSLERSVRLLNSFPEAKFDQHDGNRKNEDQDNWHHLLASIKPSRYEQIERNSQVVSKTISRLAPNKHANKTVKSPPSVLKKSPNAQYSYVKSSGYGRNSISVKSHSADEHFYPKENLEKKLPPNKKQKNGILSATRTIRFAEDLSSAQLHEVAGVFEFGLHGEISDNKSTIHDIGASDLTMLQRLQNVEDRLNASFGQPSTTKEDLSKMDKELEIENIKEKYEEQIKQLNQDKYILESKLNAEERDSLKIRGLFFGNKDPVTDEKVHQIRQEIEEQETLLKGYQQENERLYQQVKELQLKNKQNEQLMFKENQSLKADVISLREKLKGATINNHYTAHGVETSDQNFTELMAELRTLQKREKSLTDEIAKCKQEKQALTVDLAQMKKEHDLLKSQVSNISDDKSYEMKIMEDGYKQEICRLNKRLQWFAENQELLDKDSARLKDAYEQIEQLKIQVEKLTQDTGSQSAQQQKRLKDRAADAKRIQDLERQVKEMEAVIKRRHPNSIPAIMYAAAMVSESDNSTRGSTVSFLERRIQNLESQLESKDDDTKKSLRSMEQQFQKVKIQYESRIKELEEILAQEPVVQQQNRFENTVKVKALEQELSIVKDAHHITVMNLQKEIEALKEKNSLLELKASSKCNEMEPSKLTKLNRELLSKSKEIQELSKTVEKLQKERMLLLSSKPNSNSNVARGKHLDNFTLGAAEYFPAQDEKLYQPDTFMDSHISDLLQENERLNKVVYNLSQEITQQKSRYETSLAQQEDTMRRLKAENAEQIATLKHCYQKEKENLICQHAMEHSSSKVAELNSKMSMQEILIKHLQNQVHDLQKDRECLAVLRIREETLQKEITKLLEELKTAREYHTPEMKHFLMLESKIKQMDVRHSQREQELQQIIQQTRHVAESTQARETDKWKKLVQQKNMEIEQFRSELDAILEVLRVLQRQGIVIPTTASEGCEIWRQI